MKVYACDFETTTDNPQKVAVWSAESIEVGKEVEAISDNCIHQTNIEDFIDYVSRETLKSETRWYFHNLKFDGSYILDYLYKAGYQLCTADGKELSDHVAGMKKKQKEALYTDRMFSYSVNDKNVIYSIVIKFGDNLAEFRDSLKLLPFPLKKIAKDFGTAHKKLEMDFSGKYPGYLPSSDEMKYIENDVFVLKEALEIFADLTGTEVHDLPFTIGSCAMSYFKSTLGDSFREQKGAFMHYFTLQTKTFVNGETYDSYVRKSYHGGWCYVNPKIKGKVIREKGGVYDVNSLYPSVMHSESGCFYPRGKGCLRAGGLDKDEKQAYKKKHLYYFIRFKCSFEIKPDHLPTVQIKGDPLYDGSVWLTTSKIYDKRNNEWLNHDVIMTMTCTDFDLFLDHYDVTDLEIYDHINYRTQTGVFDDYINYWAEIKKKSKGALRTFAKLMLNNLYGKFSTSPEANYIIYYLEGGLLKSDTIDMDDPSKGVYIPVGSAITSWARNFTIRTAQKNFDRFCYADTDSIHFIGSYKDMVGIVEHPTNFCCWKNETTWDKAIFAGQKRYIEEVIEEDHEPCEKYNNIKCCGLNENAKQCLDTFLQCGKYDYDIFREGLMVSGNIKSRRVEGGIFLTEQAFTFRGRYIMI